MQCTQRGVGVGGGGRGWKGVGGMVPQHCLWGAILTLHNVGAVDPGLIPIAFSPRTVQPRWPGWFSARASGLPHVTFPGQPLWIHHSYPTFRRPVQWLTWMMMAKSIERSTEYFFLWEVFLLAGHLTVAFHCFSGTVSPYPSPFMSALRFAARPG